MHGGDEAWNRVHGSTRAFSCRPALRSAAPPESVRNLPVLCQAPQEVLCCIGVLLLVHGSQRGTMALPLIHAPPSYAPRNIPCGLASHHQRAWELENTQPRPLSAKMTMMTSQEGGNHQRPPQGRQQGPGLRAPRSSALFSIQGPPWHLVAMSPGEQTRGALWLVQRGSV